MRVKRKRLNRRVRQKQKARTKKAQGLIAIIIKLMSKSSLKATQVSSMNIITKKFPSKGLKKLIKVSTLINFLQEALASLRQQRIRLPTDTELFESRLPNQYLSGKAKLKENHWTLFLVLFLCSCC